MSDLKNNLVEGNVVKQLIMFSIPFLISNIIQALYNVADMMIVGNFAGTVSISGVNIGGQVTFILTNLALGLCVGGTVLIGQYLGANKKEDVVQTIGTLFSMLVIFALALTAFMLVFKNQVLNWLQTPADSYSESSDYLLITSMGIVFIFGYNALSGVMRGLGDSKTPLIFVSISCVVNVILDFILVGAFGMKAQGAAIATIISQAVSMILCIVYLKKKSFVFDFKLASFKIHKDKLQRICKIGVPSSVQNMLTSMSFLILTAVINMVGGVAASAAVGIVGKVNSFGIMPSAAIGASVAAMAAQNLGAREVDRARKTMHTGVVLAFAVSAVVFLIIQVFPAQIIGLFNDEDPEMVLIGVEYMRSFSFDYLLVPFVFIFNGLFMGAGHTTFTLVNNLSTALLVRVPVAVIFGFAIDWGFFGIGLCGPLASVAGLIFVLWFYLSKRWEKGATLV